VVFCNAITTDEAEVQLLSKSKEKALDEAPKKALLEHEIMDEKGLLPLPGMPKWAIVTKRIEDVTKSQCKDACDGDLECAGFQYVAAEKLCEFFREPKKPDKSISLKKAKSLLKAAVRKAVKEAKSKAKKKQASALMNQEETMAGGTKPNKSAGAKFRAADKKLAVAQRAYKKAKKAAKEANRKSKGGRAAELITKSHEHQMMLKELHAAKEAQAAGLNFEEQVIMAPYPTSKNVLIAKAHKTTQLRKEEQADAAFEEAKVVMKKGLKLQQRMAERKVKRVEDMVRKKGQMKKSEAKHKVAGKAYKANERQIKNEADEKKEKLAAKARIFLKKQTKKSERKAKAVETATSGNKELRLKKCRKAQVKMRGLKYKLKRRLKKQVYRSQRKVTNKKIERLKAGMRKKEERKAALIKKETMKGAHQSVRREFDMSEEELQDMMSTTELGESQDEKKDIDAEAAEAKAKAEKEKVDADFKEKERADAIKVAGEKSKEVSQKSEEINALKLELAGKPKDPAETKTKIASLEPEYDKAQAELKKLDDKVTELKNAAGALDRKAAEGAKTADKDAAEAERAQQAKADAKLALEKKVAEAKREARKREHQLHVEMMKQTAKKTTEIRKHMKIKSKEIIRSKWAEMRRKLKLKTVRCQSKEETQTAKLKRQVALLKRTMSRIKKSKSDQKAKLKRKTEQERRAKADAAEASKVKLKEYEHNVEMKSKQEVKDKEKEAAKEIDVAKHEAEKEKELAVANEKKADDATAEAKAEADKLKSEEQAAAASKLDKPAAAPAAESDDGSPPVERR